MKRAVALALSFMLLVCLCSCEGGPSIADSSASEPASSGKASNADTTSLNSGSGTNPDSDNNTAEAAKLFEGFNQSACVYAVDVTDCSSGTLTMLRSLQGLVAANEEASIYLIGSESDTFWKSYLRDEMGVYFKTLTPKQLINKFSDTIKTVVEYTSGTYEFEVAWNTAIKSEGAIIADENTIKKYSLESVTGEIYDVRGKYTDKESAYNDMFTDYTTGGIKADYVSFCGEESPFNDYAYAVGAVKMNFADNADWESQMFSAMIDSTERASIGAALFDGEPDCAEDADFGVAQFSKAGFGCINVSNFSNATLYSSIGSGYKTTAKHIKYAKSGSSGNVYLSIVIDTDSIGSSIQNDYVLWTAKHNRYNVSLCLSPLMYKLAPSVLLWYSVNTRGDNQLISSGDWLKIDDQVMPDDLYVQWRNENNYLVENSGLYIIRSTDSRSGVDMKYCYGRFTNADGVFVNSDSIGNGIPSHNANVALVPIFNALTVEEFINSIADISANDVYSQYYAVSIPAATIISEANNSDAKEIKEANRFDEIEENLVAQISENLGDSLKIVNPNAFFSSIK